MRFSFSTESLEPEARFEGFRDALVRPLFQFEFVSRTNAPYRGVVDLCVGGPAVFGQVYGSPAEFGRTQDIACQCEEGVWLLLNRNGRLQVTQGDVQRVLAPGDGIIFDGVRAHSLHCLMESDTWLIQVPDAAVRSLRPKSAAYQTTVLSAEAGLTRMIAGVLEAHQRVVDHIPPESGYVTARYLADLVAVALGPSRDGSAITNERGLRAARLQAVLDDIEHHYLDADLSAELVAHRLGVTTRYVHLMLEATGRTFSEHVLGHRLTLARRLLLDPARRALRVSEIAYLCGFSDLSYFNRTFRRRFSETPREVRL